MKKFPKGLIWLLAVLLLAGCGLSGEETVPSDETRQETEETVRETSQAMQEEESKEERLSEEKSPEEGTEVSSSEDSFYYAYGTLETQEMRQLYREMLQSLQNRENETELSTLNPDLLESVFGAVMADHPEIFYADGYSSTVYKLGNSMKKITFTGTFTMEEEEIRRRQELLNETVAGWMAGLKPEMDDYEKVKYLYEYLIVHTEYEQGAPDSQNICSVLLNGKSVCQGYAKTLQLLCQKAGLEAFLVTGQVGGQGHAWDLIRLDGEWYHVDPTWGDASYLREGESPLTAASSPAVNFDYFCVTTDQISQSHCLGEGQKLPACTAVADHYYRREGLFLTQADEEQIRAIFERAVQNGQAVVTFQCADDEVYDQVYRMLIEEQKVFAFLPGENTQAAYTDSPDRRTFSFWLEQ